MPFLKSDRPSGLSDNELISRFRYSYDPEYVGELFQRYTHMLFGVCLKYLQDEEKAKDAVMSLFEKVVKDLKRHEVENFRTWVYSVAKNHCLMDLRKERTIRPHKQNYDAFMKEIVENEDPMHLNGISQVELDGKLVAAIDTLKDDQKTCIQLFYFEKKSYENIVETTDYTYKEVKSHLQNAKRNLKNKLTGTDG
ncbi:MAG: RNA polymerase sigma-70 factor (ECF subfamily) [Granulosicoccus sp.]|jgi:RNA polymerase sigma-70 factor (ECF subfamily)